VVTDSQGQPVSGVTVTLEGTQSGQQTTGGSGTYSFSGLAAGSYTLTPSKAGYVFNPSSITYPNLQANKTDANFTAMPSQQTVFNKNVNYAYNGVGALGGVGTNLIGSDPNATTNVLNTVSFRGTGALKSLNYGNGRRLQMGYYAQRQQPASMKVDRVNNANDKIIDYAYEYYDAHGKNNNRIRTITDNVDSSYTTTYLYDDYSRLTNATSPAHSSYFLYDEWGNLKNLSGLQINHATNASGAPATNRISTAVSGSTTLTHTYDAAGNMTSDGQQTFSYDGANRLKEVGSGGQNVYGYDGDGRRVRVVANGGIPTSYVRSSVLKNTAIEANQNGVVRAYVYAKGNLVAQQSRDGQFYWLHTNHLGSGMKLTDSTGAMKQRTEFAPYGQTLLEWSASGDTYLNTKKFTGYERGEGTGLDSANARTYNSGQGRFSQPDPIRLKAASLKSPQSLNLYSYVENDPVNFFDSTGKNKSSSCMRLRSWTDHDDGTRSFSYAWYCSNSGDDGGGENSSAGSYGGSISTEEMINRVDRAAMKKAFKDLGPGCKTFFDVDPNTSSGRANLREVEDFIDTLTFKEDSTLPIIAATSPNFKEIGLGKYFFNPAGAPGRVLPQENSDADFQRNTLVHEYMHAKWQASHTWLYDKWELRDKGYVRSKPGELPLSDEVFGEIAVSEFIANDRQATKR
jgi:RHS repeat-associated protein